MIQKLKKSKLLSAALAYTLGNFLLKGINFFTVPIFTRLLTIEDYGVIAIYTTWSGIFSIFMGLGIHGTIASAKSNLNDSEYKEYLSSTLFLATLSFLIIAIISIVFKDDLAKLIGMNSSIIILLVVQSFFGFVISFVSSKYTFDQETKKYLIVSFLVTIANIILSIIMILNLNTEKYLGRIYGGAIATIVVGLILYFQIMKSGKVLIRKKYWVFCIPIAIPIIFHNLSHLILNQADRVMLQYFTDSASVGIYSFTYNIGIILNIVNMSINNAWVAWYFKALKDNLKDDIKEKAKIYILFFSIITAMFILGSVEIVKILAPKEYYEGITTLPLIILGYYFVFLYTFAINYEFYIKKTKFIAIGTIIAAILNIGINILMIPKFGIYAAAISTLVAYLALFIIHEVIVRKIFKHNDFPFKYYVNSILFILAITVVFYILIKNLIIRWILIILCLLFSGIIIKRNFNTIKK